MLRKKSCEIGKVLQLTQSHVDYWIKKKYDPDFHSSGWGKHKNRKRVFSEDEMPRVFCSFQTYIKENPYAKVADIHSKENVLKRLQNGY